MKREARGDRGRKATGREGEELAVGYLKKMGYVIIERNYRNRFGEIDVIARDRGSIVFVEVKTRGTARFGEPETAVGPAKQKRMARASLCYLQGIKGLEENARFDVVAIKKNDSGLEIRHIKDAFDVEI